MEEFSKTQVVFPNGGFECLLINVLIGVCPRLPKCKQLSLGSVAEQQGKIEAARGFTRAQSSHNYVD